MLTFLLGNLKLKALALGFAVVLWGVVAYSENPTVRNTYTLPVDHSSLPASMLIVGDNPSVSVTVTASAQTHFDQRSLQVQADFSHVHPGVNSIPVHVLTSNSAVTLDAPSSILVRVDEWTSLSLPVTIQRLKTPPTGFHEVAGSATTVPSKVTVQGPKSQMTGVQAVVQVNLTDQPFDEVMNVHVLDGAGHQIDRGSAVPANVEVKIPVQPDEITETKAAGAAIAGQPSAGYSVTNIQVSPLSVQATGLADVLAGLKLLASDPVDVGGATADVVRTVRLRPPAGVQVSPLTVQVHVFITKNPQASPSPGA